jgi:tetratricopeptide (TPR) repeat protein
VARLYVEDEPDWNAAEAATGLGQWDVATDAYEKVLRTTQKTWLKTRAAIRLLEVAAKAQRYDSVINAYVSLVHTDSGQALAHRPVLPEVDSAYVDGGLATVQGALAEAGLNADQKEALLSVELDLYRVKKDDAHAQEVLGKMNELVSAPSDEPGAARRFAEAKLTGARMALDRKDYDGAIAAITAARGAILEPGQQEEALYLLARAMDGRAGNSPEGLKDAGLAYMRVVAHFEDVAGNRHVADALAGCAGVLERLKETKIAADLYEQAAIQYDTRPEAQGAREKARRLRAGR